ncbi:MAG: DciA family protein [Nostocaceae cyanobacterium]|nr:DciA family protein [Nostocaceae cyanobacterium]
MSLKSVNDILELLSIEAKLQQHPFQQLLKLWASVVGAVIANHAQPVSIQRNVLWVATSSAAWAQNLTFERQRLLSKLNALLPTPLVDIRFSTAQWQRLQKNSKQENSKQQASPLPQQHPSYLGEQPTEPRKIAPTAKGANAVFAHWSKTIQMRSHHLPLCPQCNCPTPPGELQRWQVCSICAAKQFSTNT